MYGAIKQVLARELESLREQGLFKDERVLEGAQGAEVRVGGKTVLNFCANNYLGLASDPRVVEAARRTLDRWAYGLSSVRFICGTTELHTRLEQELAEFLGMEAALLYAACFDANGGVFEPLLGEGSAIITDQLNHASIIDGVRLAKANRLIYRHADMESLEHRLRESQGAPFRLIVTDGVFSMDGDFANLPAICDLADRYDALVLVDESHATGFTGPTGRGTPEKFGVMDRVDLITTTLGKALGGALGGATAGPREIIAWLRQKSRPYLFSNSLPPVVCGATLEVLRICKQDPEPLHTLDRNQKRIRAGLTALGFDIDPGDHPIVPVHFRKFANDAILAQRMSRDLLAEGIYCIGFSFPVVPRGQARIRLQASAAHTGEHIDKLLDAFALVGRRHGAI
ncbi:MAG TPA: glycine C-acetyltransferase [Candidatus Krumholzibacteria bacterium]|nr:glycine C-acetyltransferase [Candidatus Krumholzibacteria bacterium]HPD71050.1 glycine C-acetyltransferase [Candidatus Krumholzibacteria bacterium]HRY39250.1 glycine C-acetyltransferase [Candidatus Krumholzibacteria bacterium]